MSIKHIPEGGDFEFPKEFGFHGSHGAKVPVSDSENVERHSPPGMKSPHRSRHTRMAESGQSDHGHLPHEGHEPEAAYAHGGHHAVEEGEDKDLESHGMAHGGHHHMHPHGHHVVRVEHHPHGVVHHHAHGGYTVHHHDGAISHHHRHGGVIAHHAAPHMAHGGHPDGHHSGEGTYVGERAHGGHHGDEAEDRKLFGEMMKEHEGEGHARGGGMEPRLPRGMRPKAARHQSEIGSEMPVNRPPRAPRASRTPPNMMPGDTMGMGVQPSSEPDAAGAGQGIPQLKHGGRPRH